MRILNVSQNYFVVGGMDVAMFTLERVLRDHGHAVIPFAAADAANAETPFAGYFPAAPRTEASGASLLRTLYAPGARAALARLLDEHPVDLVHLHSYFKRLTPAILPELRRRGLPVVQTLHEYRAVCPVSTLFRDGHVCTDCAHGAYAHVIRHRCAGGSLARSAWNYAEMRLSDWLGHKRDIARFVTVSDYQRDMLIAMGMEADKLVTVHHPVELPPAPPDPRAGEHVLFFGRLETAKGADLLPEIAAGLADAGLEDAGLRDAGVGNARLVIAGDGSRRAEIARAVDARGLTNVVFAGMLRGAALDDAIARASCVIVPSLWPEAFGLTAVEALAHGTPVVASAIGGMLDTVRDGVDGYLVPPGDVAAMVERVRRLVADPARARAMGLAGRARMATDFSADVFYDRTMRVYEDALRVRQGG
ncbi:glycosyltransferase family 4 protein [Sphingomonas sp.]|uniref:glycosyltransferase family 4 protein n=1 Tax=Sphingomonas sp. TaxID=28214 RepID=UPI0035C846A5